MAAVTCETRLGIAVSGGPDSVALLLLANAAFPICVEAATINHGLRPESGAEAEWVARLCDGLNIPHRILPVSVKPGNVQSKARYARYAALAAWAAERELPAIATAHHADDQAETLVMRLNRGSGLSGLAGIRASTCVPGTGLPLVRPLLTWRRDELAAIVGQAKIEALHDPSNDDARFDRVRVRTALRDNEWLDIAGLVQSASHLAEATDYVGAMVDAEWEHRASVDCDSVRLLPPEHRFLQVALVRRAIAHISGNEPRGGQVAALTDHLRAGDGGNVCGVLATVRGDRWHFGPEPARRN